MERLYLNWHFWYVMQDWCLFYSIDFPPYYIFHHINIFITIAKPEIPSSLYQSESENRPSQLKAIGERDEIFVQKIDWPAVVPMCFKKLFHVVPLFAKLQAQTDAATSDVITARV